MCTQPTPNSPSSLAPFILILAVTVAAGTRSSIQTADEVTGKGDEVTEKD